MPSMQPLQALSVQSFHNDSPPFIGTNELSLEHREVPQLDLTVIPERPASSSSSQDSSVVPEKQRTILAPAPVASIKLPVEQGLARARLQFSRPASAFAASAPGSPEEREFSNSLPNGDFETDAEIDPPRSGTPIKLDLEPQHYHFPRHRLNARMTGELAWHLT